MRVLKIFVRSVYGSPTIYPACDQSKAIAALAKQKTLTPRELALAKVLGFEIEQVADPELSHQSWNQSRLEGSR